MSGKYGGLDPATAESLLTGGRGQSARDERLSSLLTAASGPVTTDELASEEAVMAAFARSRGHRAAGGHRRLRSRLAQLLASKTAAVALIGSVAAGGAFATGGSLPIPFNGPSSGGDIAPPTGPATESPQTATPGTEEESEDGPTPEATESPDPTLTSTPTALPTGSPAPGTPTVSPTDPAGDPTSPSEPTDEPTRPDSDGRATESPEDPGSSADAAAG